MRYLVILLVVFLHSVSATADGLALPKGAVLLTISGDIELTNSARGAEFDLEMLESMSATTITTETPWTDTKTTFTGVRINELLNAVGARSSSFRAGAFDGYWSEMPEIDFEKYPIIVAYKQNDNLMSTRDLGPLWIMFPFDDFPELLTETNKAACVWHFETMIVSEK